MTMLPLVLPLLSLFSVVRAQVTATFPNGPTNPEAPSFAAVGSTVNQTSYARLLTLNGVDDFCLFGPPETGPDQLIGNVEPIVVAYCTKPRNNARWVTAVFSSGSTGRRAELCLGQVDSRWRDYCCPCESISLFCRRPYAVRVLIPRPVHQDSDLCPGEDNGSTGCDSR